MPKIRAFKALRYNQAKIGDIAKVVAPPYDIISPSRQEELYKTHPYNVIRLELGKTAKADDAKNNRYTRAKKFLKDWIDKNILIRDIREAIYIYSQEYEYNKHKSVRLGFLSLMGIDGSDEVLPHENTLRSPKVDRLNLMKSAAANLSPIFILYEDKGHEIVKTLKAFCKSHGPVINIAFEGVRNKVWVLDDTLIIKKIRNLMAKKESFIADGHHRYEVSKMYSQYVKMRPVSKELKDNSRYIMVYFAEANENTLTVLPAHRLVKDTGALTKGDILAKLGRYFSIEKIFGLNKMMSRLSALSAFHTFGMYLGGKEFYLLKLKDVAFSDDVIRNKPLDWKRLDVSILHLFILQHALGLRDEDDNIEFVKSASETAKLVDGRKFKIAFFLNPTKARQVKRIAKLGERMPRKATYFYPKPISGLVINKH